MKVLVLGVGALLLSAALVPSVSSAAYGNPLKGLYCQALFQPTVRPSFLKTEDFRVALYDRAEQKHRELQTFETMQLKTFREAVKMRDLVTEEVIQSNIELSPTLTRMHMTPTDLPPELSKTTSEVIKDKKMDPLVLRRHLERDPYFAWLKHNSLKQELRKRTTNRNRVYHQEVQIEPVDLFLKLRSMGLPPEIALIQTQVRLDPTLSQSAVSSGEDALTLYEARRILEQKLLPFVASRERTDVSLEAWNAIPDLASGQRVLRDLFDHHIRTVGERFPRAAFERVQILSIKGDPAMDVIASYNLQKMDGFSESQIMTHVQERLAALRDKLGLQKNFPLRDLPSAVNYILRNKSKVTESSYEMFLLKNFYSERLNTINRRAIEVRRLVEVAEILSMKESDLLTYLQDEAKRETEKYFQ